MRSAAVVPAPGRESASSAGSSAESPAGVAAPTSAKAARIRLHEDLFFALRPKSSQEPSHVRARLDEREDEPARPCQAHGFFQDTQRFGGASLFVQREGLEGENGDQLAGVVVRLAQLGELGELLLCLAETLRRPLRDQSPAPRDARDFQPPDRCLCARQVISVTSAMNGGSSRLIDEGQPAPRMLPRCSVQRDRPVDRRNRQGIRASAQLDRCVRAPGRRRSARRSSPPRPSLRRDESLLRGTSQDSSGLGQFVPMQVDETLQIVAPGQRHSANSPAPANGIEA